MWQGRDDGPRKRGVIPGGRAGRQGTGPREGGAPEPYISRCPIELHYGDSKGNSPREKQRGEGLMVTSKGIGPRKSQQGKALHRIKPAFGGRVEKSIKNRFIFDLNNGYLINLDNVENDNET